MIYKYLLVIALSVVGRLDADEAGNEQVADILSKTMLTTKSPCDNFYEYVCGLYVPTIINMSVPFGQIQLVVNDVVDLVVTQSIINVTNVLSQLEPGNDEIPYWKQQTSIAFRALSSPNFNDTNDLSTLQSYLDSYGGWPPAKPHASMYAGGAIGITGSLLSRFGRSTLLSIEVAPDFVNASQQVLQISRPPGQINYTTGAAMPLDVDKMTTTIIYYAQALGAQSPNQILARQVAESLAILNNASWNSVNWTSQPSFNYHYKYQRMTLVEASNRWPLIDWSILLWNLAEDTIGFDNIFKQPFIIFHPSYIDALQQFLIDADATLQQSVALYNLISMELPPLMNERNALMRLFGQSNEQQIEYSEYQATKLLQNLMPFAFARILMDSRGGSDPIANQHVTNIVNFIRLAFEHEIETTTWLNDAERSLAKSKLNHLVSLIGYPQLVLFDDQLNQYYAQLSLLDDDDTFVVANKILNFHARQQLSPLGQSSNRFGWQLNSIFVDAQYDQQPGYLFQYNSMMIPLEYLIAPLFQSNFPYGYNFAVIGQRIAAEMSLALGIAGIHYGVTGDYYPSTWLSDNSTVIYNKKLQCYNDEYSNLCIESNCIDYKHNVALIQSDNLGFTAALNAYKSWVNISGADLPMPPIDGRNYTWNQMFYLSYVSGFCGNSNGIPNSLRVQGVILNEESFYTTFECGTMPNCVCDFFAN